MTTAKIAPTWITAVNAVTDGSSMDNPIILAAMVRCPVSSTGHLTIAAKMMGLSIDDPSVTAFTAVIQVGAIFAVVIYFWTEIVVLVRAWVRGLFNADRRTDPDYRLAWLVLIGSLPIVVVGYLGRDIVAGPLRSLWVVAFALIIWGGVMLLAEAVAKQD